MTPLRIRRSLRNGFFVLFMINICAYASIFQMDSEVLDVENSNSEQVEKIEDNSNQSSQTRHWGSSQKNLNDGLNDSVAKMIHESNANGTISHPPPDFFQLAGRISTSSNTIFSYFEDENIPSIPFLECNDVGTTTPPIETLHASFRNFPKSAHPTSFSNSKGFIVPLTKLDIQTSNGDARVFDQGQIIWVDGDYRLSSAGSDDMKALIVEVPSNTQIGLKREFFGFQKHRLTCNDIENNTLVTRFPTKKLFLSMIGLTLSSLMTYFWVKVAPLQLAVGFGGACMVAGGTMGVVICGEKICDLIEASLRDRRLDQDIYFEEEDIKEEKQEEQKTEEEHNIDLNK